MSIDFIELPAFFLDAIVFDDLNITPGAIFLEVFNRDPEPDQDDVRVNTLISFDVAGSLANPPILAQTTIELRTTPIGGSPGPYVLAYDGSAGGFQSGYDGPLSAVTVIDSSTTRFVIDYTSLFESESTVDVRLNTNSTGLPNPLESEWSFIIEDITAPKLLEAMAISQKIVRLLFDEPVKLIDTVSTDSALNPLNYQFIRTELFSVDIEAVEVTAFTTTSVDVEVDIEMTPGLVYNVVVSNIEDLRNNVILAPYNTAAFSGFLTNVPIERNFELWRMLPRINRDSDNGDLFKFISCLQEVTNLLLSDIDYWVNILDPDIASEIFIDAMLQDLGNPFEFDLELIDKRKLVKLLVEIYKQKGTGIGIINVIRFFLDIEVEINSFSGEGWDLGIDELGDSVTDGTAILGSGLPYNIYSFEIISPVALTDSQRDQITDIANYMKPAHTHLIRIVEPEIPIVIDHLELGLSILGDGEWWLH
jgi:phage tail-like protein